MSKKKDAKDDEVIEINLDFSKQHVYLLITLAIGFGLGYATHLLTGGVTGAAVNVPKTSSESTQPGTSNPTGGSVNLKVLNDPDCEVCDPSGIISSLQNNVGLDLNVQTVEYDSAEGRELIEKFSLKGIPAYFFDSTITESSGYEQLRGYITKEGDDYMLAVSPAKYTEPLEGWTGTKPTVMLFVMSQCPFGVQAEKAAKPLVDAFGDEIDFQVHYIATDNGDGTFSSLHGESEVNGDLRQVCIQEHYPSKFWDYLMCVEPDYQQIGGVWQDCATQNGIDVQTVTDCAESSEGEQLLKDSIAVTQEFGVTGSPTTFVVEPSGMFYRADIRSPAQVQSLLCEIDSSMSGCEAELEGTSSQASGSC